VWVEELVIENVKCYDKIVVRLGTGTKPHRWVTLLGENGTGKSTFLQALCLALAGPEITNQLVRPVGWLRDESALGKISAKIHKDDHDKGDFGHQKKRQSFAFTLYITGGKKLTINKKLYSEPAIIENRSRTMTWLRSNAFSADSHGWFAVGYGAFRRLTRKNQIIVPSLQKPDRITNFHSQFNENEPLAALEQWLVYLDYRIVKDKDREARRLLEIGINALNGLLPEGTRYDSVTSDGRILFNSNGSKVATINLSDGYRSVLALGGDLIWRLLEAFPGSEDPLQEEGVVVIDELDIHLHPSWQRNIAGWLREKFPKLQFIMATHSPMVAAGAGEDAVTYRFRLNKGNVQIDHVPEIDSFNVDKILQSSAFGLVSTFSPQMQKRIDQYYNIKQKKNPSKDDEKTLQTVLPFIEKAFAPSPKKGSLDERINSFLDKKLP